ncbi:FAD-dependent pyridine nucleotide-disulfide oxidoreductase [Segniliparus rotundus DSM 44985]|uniref:FAD-dependent pyridine nucleotide-disulfide oxidoreductase n=1 Tax=Segniliparus rotundus (strain ATCC BAA-972 / CDC 1076 / CIP 108378 / DSM 44985 / JCM 13578) TaxID=640132 RepID=D6ZB21_SEGRD|nr:FAD/NAD(P)-binding oxidoreductase [Segniliparus rotundus]ADG96780.1 FAD-dependent pyridine nucleotide-disulfide oxidoreductase [Segniliparus rotundus DSM 44985]
MDRKRIVVLGAGIGGLSVVKELRESRAPLDDVDVVLVDQNFEHYLGFTLPWVMRGWRDEQSVPIRPTQNALDGLTTVQGKVVGVDPAHKTVALDDGAQLGFDALVLALGAQNTPGEVPGLHEALDAGSAVHYYSAAEAGRAHRALQHFDGGKLVFLVASQPYRCPVAPYEGALLAADLLHERGVRETTEISVHTPEPQPMPSAGPHAGPKLVELLHEQGIAFHPGHAVQRVDHHTKTVRFADGETAPFDLLVFVPPHKPALSLRADDWISVDRQNMRTEHEGVWAVGDIASVTSPSGKTLPKAAIFAKNGGKAVARDLLRHFGKTNEPGSLSGLGYCFIDTGGHEAARGAGDFFALPHPDVVLEPPSEELHHDKAEEERAWRAFWE